MKSQRTKNKIEVIKRLNLGKLPLFLSFGHKGLEKGNPEGREAGGEVSFNIPKDILGLTITTPALLAEIESVEFSYAVPKKV